LRVTPIVSSADSPESRRLRLASVAKMLTTHSADAGQTAFSMIAVSSSFVRAVGKLMLTLSVRCTTI